MAIYTLILHELNIDDLDFKLQIFQLVSAIVKFNMKTVTKSCLVFVIIAIAIIAKATGKLTSFLF